MQKNNRDNGMMGGRKLISAILYSLGILQYSVIIRKLILKTKQKPKTALVVFG